VPHNGGINGPMMMPVEYINLMSSFKALSYVLIKYIYRSYNTLLIRNSGSPGYSCFYKTNTTYFNSLQCTIC
jgi:hypothetical protein